MSRLSELRHLLSASDAAELQELRERAAAPLALRRRIGVASLASGAGCTTIAVELARFLAAVRGDRVRFVRAQGPSSRPAPGPDGSASALASASASVDSVASGGVEVLGLAPTEWPADVEAWWKLHRASSDRYDLTVTDWGATPLERIRDLAEHSHVLCLVTAADRASVQRALDVAAAVGANTRVVLVAVDAQRVAGPAAERLVANLPFPSVLMRHDRSQAGGAAGGASRGTTVGRREQRGLDGVRMLRLGARVIDAAAGVAAQPVPVPTPPASRSPQQHPAAKAPVFPPAPSASSGAPQGPSQPAPNPTRSGRRP